MQRPVPLLMKVCVLCFLISVELCHAQNSQKIRLTDLQRIISGKSEKICVINFWATWCGPCVKELPFFEQLNAAGREDIQVILVSLDLDLDPDAGKVDKFVARKNIRSKVYLLDEADPNSWINKVDQDWTGALPATLLVNQRTGERKFLAKALREGELETYIDQIR